MIEMKKFYEAAIDMLKMSKSKANKELSQVKDECD